MPSFRYTLRIRSVSPEMNLSHAHALIMLAKHFRQLRLLRSHTFVSHRCTLVNCF